MHTVTGLVSVTGRRFRCAASDLVLLPQDAPVMRACCLGIPMATGLAITAI